MPDLNGDLRILYEGKFVFSQFARGHVSWCHLKVIQGHDHALVIFGKAEDNPGTAIANAIELLATQVVNLFDLKPETTVFLERTPPVDRHTDQRQWAAGEMSAQTHPLTLVMLLGTSEDTYEHIGLQWSESRDYDQPEYRASDPTWTLIPPAEVIRQVYELEAFSE